jgi:hypothetical protein
MHRRFLWWGKCGWSRAGQQADHCDHHEQLHGFDTEVESQQCGDALPWVRLQLLESGCEGVLGQNLDGFVPGDEVVRECSRAVKFF